MDRIVDNHDFQVVSRGRRGSCRLQVFVASGQRPVMVATQSVGSAGVSLTNGAEDFAVEAWRRYLPASVEPPRWIEHYEPDGTLAERPHWLEVEFTVGFDGTLSEPRWCSCGGLVGLAELIGGPVDSGRGDYVPPPPPVLPVETLVLVPVFRLPRSVPFRAPHCMPAGLGMLRRCWRQVHPVIGPRGCCWYHGGDWRVVMRRVVDVIGESAARRGVVVDADRRIEFAAQAREVLRAEWEREAADSLLLDSLIAEGGRWTNGQHRAQAIGEAGCRFALLERSEYPAAATE